MPLRGVLDRQGLRGRGQATLGEGGEDGRAGGVAVLRQCRRHVHDVASALTQHVANDELAEREEAVEVGAEDGGVVVGAVVGERLGHEHAGVVDQRVDVPELRQGLGDDPSRIRCGGDVALDGQQVGVVARLDRPSRRHDRPTELSVAGDDPRPDPLRPARDDRDVLSAVSGCRRDRGSSTHDQGRSGGARAGSRRRCATPATVSRRESRRAPLRGRRRPAWRCAGDRPCTPGTSPTRVGRATASRVPWWSAISAGTGQRSVL